MYEELIALRGLSFGRLHALILLSDAGSLIAAAEGDCGAQSRLSHQLRELSEFFGVELTAKAGKTIKLTKKGESLAQMAREQFANIQAFRNQFSNTAVEYRVASGDSLMQSLVIPAIGSLRRGGSPQRITLSNLRTREIVEQLKDRKLEFGILRADAVDDSLKQVRICDQTYAVFVPGRLVPSRGLLSVGDALMKCPHAAIGGDGQLMDRLRGLAEKLGGSFVPELTCDSIGQCVAAVRTGSFAAVLPVKAWTPPADKDYIVVEDATLEALSRPIALAWHPRTLEVLGTAAKQMQKVFGDALKQAWDAGGS